MTPELQEDIEKVLDWAETEPEVWLVCFTQKPLGIVTPEKGRYNYRHWTRFLRWTGP
jgi:hypothetical protein